MHDIPVSMLVAGNAKKVRDHTRKLCECVGEGGGYIFNGAGREHREIRHVSQSPSAAAKAMAGQAKSAKQKKI